jgi:hypothetical protein
MKWRIDMSDIHKEIEENIKKQKQLESAPSSDEKVQRPKAGFLKKAATFTESMVSRGIKNNKAEPLTIELRQLSCHGDSDKKLPPCADRKDSVKFPGSHFCGACGCGDKELTQLSPRKLDNGQDAYYKLEYPKVHCPLMMPGFTNYVPTTPGVSENPRKKFIEFSKGIEYIRDNSK